MKDRSLLSRLVRARSCIHSLGFKGEKGSGVLRWHLTYRYVVRKVMFNRLAVESNHDLKVQSRTDCSWTLAAREWHTSDNPLLPSTRTAPDESRTRIHRSVMCTSSTNYFWPVSRRVYSVDGTKVLIADGSRDPLSSSIYRGSPGIRDRVYVSY